MDEKNPRWQHFIIVPNMWIIKQSTNTKPFIYIAFQWHSLQFCLPWFFFLSFFLFRNKKNKEKLCSCLEKYALSHIMWLTYVFNSIQLFALMLKWASHFRYAILFPLFSIFSLFFLCVEFNIPVFSMYWSYFVVVVTGSFYILHCGTYDMCT